MGSYYIKVTIKTEIEVVDCKTIEEAKKQVEGIIKDSVLIDFFTTELKEV